MKATLVLLLIALLAISSSVCKFRTPHPDFTHRYLINYYFVLDSARISVDDFKNVEKDDVHNGKSKRHQCASKINGFCVVIFLFFVGPHGYQLRQFWSFMQQNSPKSTNALWRSAIEKPKSVRSSKANVKFLLASSIAPTLTTPRLPMLQWNNFTSASCLTKLLMVIQF